MGKQNPEPEVIVFEEPKLLRTRKTTAREKTICRSEDVSQMFSDEPEVSTARDVRHQKIEEMDFKTTLLEVQKYAVSSLTGKNRRRQEEQQIMALGGKPAKNEKMPYPLYQKKMKAQRKKERRETRELMLSGMPIPKKNEHPQRRGKGRWRDKTKDLTPHVGTFSSRGLTLSDRDIARVKKSKH